MQSHEHSPDSHQDTHSKTVLGFWIYLLTDFVLFGTLFATYAVLRNNTFGGPSAKQIFDLKLALGQSLVLLFSSLTAGLAGACAFRKDRRFTIAFLVLTFFLGIFFLYLQYNECARLIHMGNGWQRSAFLSAFFTLISTFAVHVFFALLWTVVLAIPVFREGLTSISIRRLTCLRMFWQFLNIVWIFVFTLVYGLGG